MHRKLTLTIDESVYFALYEVIGAGKISQFIENLVRPHVAKPNLNQAYKAMAQEEKREAEAEEWSENLLGDMADETR